MRVLLVFSQSHVDFRIAEFEAICEIFGISVDSSCLNDKVRKFSHP